MKFEHVGLYSSGFNEAIVRCMLNGATEEEINKFLEPTPEQMKLAKDQIGYLQKGYVFEVMYSEPKDPKLEEHCQKEIKELTDKGYDSSYISNFIEGFRYGYTKSRIEVIVRLLKADCERSIIRKLFNPTDRMFEIAEHWVLEIE